MSTKEQGMTTLSLAPTNKKTWRDFTSYFGLILITLVAVLMNPTFSSSNNIMNVLRQIATPGMLAIGMNFAIITGGIDLSIGSAMAFVGVTMAMLTPYLGWGPAMLVAIAIGAAIGVFFGFCITKLFVPAFIATLAGQMLLRGLAFVVTKSQAVPVKDESFGQMLGTANVPVALCFAILAALAAVAVYSFVRERKSQKALAASLLKMLAILAILGVCAGFIFKTGGINIQVIIFGAFFFIFWVVLNKSVFGRQVYAIGGNAEASRLAGVKVDRNLIAVYGLSGFTAAIGGILATARLSSATPQSGLMYETDAICAVVIGGTSLSGGSGKLIGTLVGVLLIGILNNLLSLENVASDYQQVAKGIIVLVAVVLDTKLKKQ